MLSKNKILPLIKLSLKEDIGKGDITTNILINKNLKIKAKMIAKEKGIIAGIKVVQWVFQTLDKKVKFKILKNDGEKVKPKETILEIEGNAHSLLKGERTALNFLQRLSGIATLTSKYVEKVKKYKVKIFDTRKTVPGWRLLDKYAVRIGGGYNHRMGLYDMILIKDNHLKLIDSIEEAIRKTKQHLLKKLKKTKIEIETENLKQVKAALREKPDLIMLDNMNLETIKKVVKLPKEEVLIEASGKINFQNIKNIAKTGVDIISLGKLTHSAKALDISMKIYS